MSKTFNFSANGTDFGNYGGETQEAFAVDAGYKSRAALVEQAEETSSTGNDIEVKEIE
jgi:hypothetical protein